MNINKDEELLVIIKNEGRFYWFVAFKEMWVLDRAKWAEDFVRSGMEINLQDIHSLKGKNIFPTYHFFECAMVDASC